MITLETLQQRPLSYSSLKEFAKSPAHYIAYLNGDKEPSKEMIFGSMLHCLLLQPKEFNSQFAVMPNVDRRTSEGKATYAKFMSEAEGKSVVQESELEDANRLVEKVMMQDHFRKLVSDCNIFENEFRQDIDGLPFRGFIDGEADNYVLEVKTASDAQYRLSHDRTAEFEFRLFPSTKEGAHSTSADSRRDIGMTQFKTASVALASP